jgi:DNA-binding response OmpR family regulator
LPCRILVVDDDESYLEGMKDLLAMRGHEPLVASTFEEGQRVLRDEAPDLLIADVRLGPFNGLQLIATGQVQIPTIVVSGFDDSVLQADARAFGADYLVKPIDTEALFALIDRIVPAGGGASPVKGDSGPDALPAVDVTPET